MKHISVLLNESIDGLQIQKGDVVVDGTLGGGGHTLEVIKRFKNDVKIICLDLDKDAIDRSKKLIEKTKGDVIFKIMDFKILIKFLRV